MKMNSLDWIALVLVVIGGINWGLVGLFEFDLVASLLGEMTAITRAVYVIVGVSAAYMMISAAMKR